MILDTGVIVCGVLVATLILDDGTQVPVLCGLEPDHLEDCFGSISWME